ncbi:MAG: EAL domain-containing protein [Candidatus Thiodiazotropha sp. (ex Lucinoma borealis)]|nr:EAL domain-containing protein [Candidatus Thiodiazotropha sp. (ex Lucinoma borealis)]
MLVSLKGRLTWMSILVWIITSSFIIPSSAESAPVRSASELDYPPFSSVLDDGRAVGFSVELMREALHAMGRSVTFEVRPWSEIKLDLEKGRLEALPLVGRTPEREEVFDFTTPYISLYGAVFVRDDEDNIKTLEDLRDRRVGVLHGDNAEEFMRREKITNQLVTAPAYEEVLLALSKGELDAVVAQRLVGLNLIEKLQVDNLKTAIAPLNGLRQDFCFAVTKGNKELLSQLNEGLSIVMVDGTYDRLHSEWLGILERETAQKRAFWVVISIFLALLSLLFIGLFIYQHWQAHRNLKASEQRYHSVVSNIKEVIFQTDPLARLTFLNTAWSKVTGFPLDESLNRPFTDFIHADDQHSCEDLFTSLIQQNKDFHHQKIRCLHKTNSFRWIEVHAQPIVDSSGKVTGLSGTLTDFTERKQLQTELQESEARFRSFFENNTSVMLLIAPTSGEIMAANTTAATFYGYPLKQLIGMPISHINTMPEEKIREERERALREKCNYFLFQHRLASGEIRDVEVYSTPIQTDGHDLLFTIVHDITDRRKIERALEKINASQTALIEALPDTIFFKDGEGRWLVTNQAAKKLFKLDEIEWQGKTEQELAIIRPAYKAAHHQRLIEDEYAWQQARLSKFEEQIVDKAGKTHLYDVRKIPIFNTDGEREGLVTVGRDVTMQREHQQQLEYIAHYDALTKLPNRVLLADRLHQAMAQTHRQQQGLAVVYLDLDGFKEINDIHGHETGDHLLTIVASRMKSTLRDGDTIARLGGDEFVVVLIGLTDIKASEQMLMRLLAAVAQPIQVDDISLRISGSLGVTFYPQMDEVDADQLLRQSDQAMYQAKLSGKNRYHFFDTEQDRNLRGRHSSLKRIRQALNEREFVLFYQPKVNMRSGEIIGVEALIRWQHPNRGLLSPAEFLPVIEDHPLAIELGDWVIETALTQLEDWHLAGLNLTVSVNIGARQLQQPDFVEHLQLILAAHPDIKPSDLELEVLETSALDDMLQVSQLMQSCSKIGVNFALDDFGTGYSSLTYLKNLPATQLKIDQSFVRDMLDDPEDLAILEGILGLARAFRRQAIAEGVETLAHGEMLLQLDCELAQGYSIAKPMPANELIDWSKTWQPDPTWTHQQPMHRNDLPLLFAGIEHRSWIHAIEECLKGERATPPQLDHHQCRFGHWLEGEGQVRYGAHPAFQAIAPLHKEAHTLATDLLELHAMNSQPVALESLHELNCIRDKLLIQLKHLVQQ